MLAAYRRHLWQIVEAVPARASEETLSASEHIGEKRAALWFGEN